MTKWWIVGVTLAGLACLSQIVIPVDSPWQDGIYYTAATVTCVVLGVAASRMPRESAGVWWGFFGYVLLAFVGDVVYLYMESVLGVSPFPGPADIFYFGCYVCAIFGLALLNRRLNPGHDSDAWIDSGIITIGAFAVFSVAVFAPILRSAETIDAAVLLSLAYPLLDLVVIAMLVRLLAGVQVRSLSLSIVVFAFAITMLSDVVYETMYTVEDTIDLTGVTDAMYLAALVLIAVAATVPGAARITDAAEPTALGGARARTLGLSVGVLVTPFVLAFVLWPTGNILERVLAVSTLAAIVLAVIRIRHLIAVVRGQSTMLAEMARTDGLTGLPNRRTLDYELDRAIRQADEDGQSFGVAMLDLDHFKAFNDEFGHQAGDALLQNASLVWGEALPPGAFLARYGGEEFAILLHGHSSADAQGLLDRLRLATPQKRTVSIGYAHRLPGEAAHQVIRRADRALYEAKESGRNRVVLDEATASAS